MSTWRKSKNTGKWVLISQCRWNLVQLPQNPQKIKITGFKKATLNAPITTGKQIDVCHAITLLLAWLKASYFCVKEIATRNC